MTVWDAVSVPVVIMLVVGSIMLYLVLVAIPRQRRATWEAALGLAARRGWKLVTPGEMPQGMALWRTALAVSGRERDRRVRLTSFVVGSGKSQQTWTALQADLETEPPSLSIREENVFTRMAEKLGKGDLKTGDVAFDQRFRLGAGDPLLVHVLLPEWRRALEQAWPARRSGAALTVSGRKVSFEALGAPTPKLLVALEPLFPLLLDLADYLEAFVESQRKR